jgi:TATA-box binding protein (TBP) (component of TFIID and TFIIIB)
MRFSVKYQNVTRNGKSFRNQICVKFFPNGNIQMTGCNTVMSIAYAIRKCYRRILSSGANYSRIFISNARIAMINTDFKINKAINQQGMVKDLSIKTDNSPHMIIFQTSKYPGINAKFLINKNEPMGKKISCLIFRPGSIIITGGPNINEYFPIVKYITGLLT